MVFDISKTAKPETIQIEVTEDSCLIGNDSYTFEERIPALLTINPKLPESIEIIGSETISAATTYTVNVYPDYAVKDVNWSIDKTDIATVDELGIVTSLTSGSIVLTAKTADGSDIYATKNIEIIKYAESIEIVGNEEITVPTQYNAAVFPDYTTNKSVDWSVSDETVATVDENGLVTPLKNGKFVLIATAKDASGITTTKSIVVTVSVRATSITSDVGIWDKEFDSDITDYTITVTNETSVIYLTTSFKNATAKANGTIVANGIRKRIALDGKETNIEIALTPTSGTEQKANTYKIKVLRGVFTNTVISEDGKSFMIKPVNVAMGNAIILALYNGEKFVEMQSKAYNGTDVPFTTDKEYTNAKVMVWESLENMKSVCDAEIVK